MRRVEKFVQQGKASPKTRRWISIFKKLARCYCTTFKTKTKQKTKQKHTML